MSLSSFVLFLKSATVPELDVKADHVKVYEKSKFSMLTDEVLTVAP